MLFRSPSSGLLDEKAELIKVVRKVRIQDIYSDKNRMDDRLTISAFFDKEESEEVMTLITRSKITVAQRFDDGE